jgi:hypothetical protein
MDTLLTFELSYEAYTTSYTPNDWVAEDPRKIWHIIYNVPQADVDQVAQLALERGAGFIHITDDTLDNPYDTLPSDSYMQQMMNDVEGGVPLNDGASEWASGSAAGAVTGLSITKSDYSSAHLVWNAAGNAIGYHVYVNSQIFASVLSTMTEITIGGLEPGSLNSFHVSAVGGGGSIGSSSNVVSITTTALPNGMAVTDFSSSSAAESTIYQANILIPYSFVRLYIWDSVDCDFDSDLGWTINFDATDYVCAQYMVEGSTLYKYNGVLPSGSTAPPWSWEVVASIPVEISGYTYTWTLPIGTSTTDTSKFVIQAQGYAPLVNAFDPLPNAYDCKGSGLCGSTPNLLAWCDHAVNDLTRSDTFFYNNS